MGTFDSRPVDGNLILSCMQLGVKNCQKMINSGSCRGFADKNGTTICSMADKIANGSSSNGNGGNGGAGGGGSNGSGGTISQPPCVRDASGACAPIDQAMAQAFEGGAGFSMAESKKVIFALISAGMLLLVIGIIKDAWRLYSGGSIEKHVLMRVVFNLALASSIMVFILSYT